MSSNFSHCSLYFVWSDHTEELLYCKTAEELNAGHDRKVSEHTYAICYKLNSNRIDTGYGILTGRTLYCKIDGNIINTGKYLHSLTLIITDHNNKSTALYKFQKDRN